MGREMRGRKEEGGKRDRRREREVREEREEGEAYLFMKPYVLVVVGMGGADVLAIDGQVLPMMALDRHMTVMILL